MIIDIVIILCWIWIAGSLFGVNPMIGRQIKKLPPVKRRMIAGERRKRDRETLRESAREDEKRRNDALRALTPGDVAFLSAGGHWTPPESVRERMRQKEFELAEHARQQSRVAEMRRRVEEEQTKRAARLRSDAENYAKSTVARQQKIKAKHAWEMQAIQEAGQKLRAIGMSVADLDNVYRPKAPLGEVIDTDLVESADGTRFELRHYSSGKVVRHDLPPLYRHMM